MGEEEKQILCTCYKLLWLLGKVLHSWMVGNCKVFSNWSSGEARRTNPPPTFLKF